VVQAVGRLAYGFERRHFIDPDLPTGGGTMDQCTTVLIPRRLSSQAARLNGRIARIQGVFRADIAQGAVINSMCNPAGIEVQSLAPASRSRK